MSQYVFGKPRRPVSRVFIHCSASDNPAHDNVATMRAWHLQRGWSDVGYHLFIRKDGVVEAGRPLEITPAAQAGHNTGTIAICLHGLDIDKFTQAQFDTLRALCASINRQYGGKLTFHGHREVAAKACPVFDYKAILNLDRAGRLGVLNIATPVRTGAAVSEIGMEEPEARRTLRPVLRLGHSGAPVEALQLRLNRLGYHVGKVDRAFGKRTRAAVLAFQADNHLMADGVVGPSTYEALDEAGPREIGEERKSAGILDLAAGGSRIAKASVAQQFAGFGLAGGGVLSVIDESTGAVSRVTQGVELFGDTLARLGPWIGLAVVIGGIYVVLQARKAAAARVADHRSGKTA
ncbi:MAG: hypothetical protein COA37_17765 [Hoeflea sp.]|uniref:peptidoglycan recognition protein family protein n=1 Tax=Hoeflea sp. TaxID=1940281 RepID=UPI000C0DB44A|nr:peptidoglycan-binding domain-containing protein [Hoeflea sp.]PHR19278.1 MAG: hypothetical protein COA37_17765 [Hoeflea sp.]